MGVDEEGVGGDTLPRNLLASLCLQKVGNYFLAKGCNLTNELIRRGNRPQDEFRAARINIGLDFLYAGFGRTNSRASDEWFGRHGRKFRKKGVGNVVGLLFIFVDVGEDKDTGLVRVYLAAILFAVIGHLLKSG